MLIPEHVCRNLYRKHKWLRWAWEGRDDLPGLNPGSFALVQLYHISDSGTYERPQTFRAFWDVEPYENEAGGTSTRRANRGPIFAKDGSTNRDWDPLFRFPIHVITLDEHMEYPWKEKIDPIADVYSGKIMHAVDYWLIPQEKRIIKSYEDRRDRVVDKCEEMGAKAADRAWWDSQQTGYSARRDIAYKHAKRDIIQQDILNNYDPIAEYLKPPKMPSKELKRSKH